MERKELQKLCLHLLETGWPAYLTTVDDKGYPQTRAMFNLRNKERFPKLASLFDKHHEDFMILFSTNTSSEKINHIGLRSKSSVYYCNPDDWQGVMFGGEIEVVEDSELKKKIWHEEWERYYPNGYDDPDHAVLKVVPTVARGWTGSSTFKLELGDNK
jgi:pyridoxamine 5'-phosphate oxidase